MADSPQPSADLAEQSPLLASGRPTLRISEIKGETGASKATIIRLLNAGYLQRIKLPGCALTFISAESYRAWLSSR